MQTDISFTLLVAVILTGVVMAFASLTHVSNPWRADNTSIVASSTLQF